jgi:hypothetical protein
MVQTKKKDRRGRGSGKGSGNGKTVKKSRFNFNSKEVFIGPTGRTRVQMVTVKNGKGMKEVREIGKNGRPTAKHSEKLTKKEVNNIQKRKFMKNLFRTCNSELMCHLYSRI